MVLRFDLHLVECDVFGDRRRCFYEISINGNSQEVLGGAALCFNKPRIDHDKRSASVVSFS